MPPIAELKDVERHYGDHRALGPLTLTLPDDASVGLLGPNGAGKSTLIRILLGIIPPTSGEVRVLGEELSPGLRRRIGYVPEGDCLFPGMTGVEAVRYAGQLVGMRATHALERAHQVLDYVELGEARYRLVENYSTGMRQRLKIAQALVHDPELLIFDEPTEGVDPEARLHILDIIRDLQANRGLRILLSTHILHDVEALATHAVILHQGRVVGDGALGELKVTTPEAHLVRVNGPSEAFTEKLDAAGVKWELLEPNLRVELADPRRILRIAEEAGLVIRYLAPMEVTLQKAFEDAIGRSVPVEEPPEAEDAEAEDAEEEAAEAVAGGEPRE